MSGCVYCHVHAIGPLIVFCSACSGLGASAQTVVWQETFDGTGNWGTLNIPAGAEQCIANPFYISCKENGNAPGTCGTGCGSNKTLHVGSNSLGDIGAAYDAGGGASCSGGFSCFFSPCKTGTDRRSSSASISTIGSYNLSLEFDYIENGSGAVDNAISEFSLNNGITWTTLLDMPKTNNAGCGGQGRWTHISIPLPAACENIGTLRIAFHWVNNNDGVGTDPSFAVNDVKITQPITLPVEMIAFDAMAMSRVVLLEWSTASERNNDHFAVEHSMDGAGFIELGRVIGAGNSQQVVHYAYTDDRPAEGMNYYRLRQVDMDGGWKLSEIIALPFRPAGTPLDEATMEQGVLVTGPIDDPANCSYTLVDSQGRLLRHGMPGAVRLRLDLRSLDPGTYLLRLKTPSRTDTRKFIR